MLRLWPTEKSNKLKIKFAKGIAIIVSRIVFGRNRSLKNKARETNWRPFIRPANKASISIGFCLNVLHNAFQAFGLVHSTR
mmetsp:Transcript_13318/g.33394  ORF Transcript_13318/g.33394 Transcript_13318/m.33394 type:complete len:81 (-) Transcript_13318:110-352(-)